MNRSHQPSGFTLVEMLVSITILTILVLFVSRLVDSAANVVSLGSKRMDAEADARPLFDRMATDFAQMVKRTDVSYYLKTSATPMSGNDHIAFFSGVPGYYNDNGRSYNSRLSLVSYRVNSDSASPSHNRVERLAKGLALNAAYTDLAPLVFLDNTDPAFYTTTIDALWPVATREFPNSNYYSSDQFLQYETLGAQVFRLEYYYLTAGATPQLTSSPPGWTDANHINIKDIAAVVVAIAVIDPQSKRLLTGTELASISQALGDFSSGAPGSQLSAWQTTLNNMTGIPRPALSSIRLYERYFYLGQ